MKKSWVPGLAVGLGATTADAFYLLITYLGWTGIASRSNGVTGWIYLVGSLVLFVYGSLMVLRQVRNRAKNTINAKPDVAKKKAGGFSYFIGLSLGFSNPYQIAWWLTVGLASISYFGSIVIIGFFGGIILWLFIFSGGLHYGASRYSNVETVVLYGSSLVLFGFAAWFLYHAIHVL
jgi:threonine/homoserine/homoserine lactone efflux protein